MMFYYFCVLKINFGQKYPNCQKYPMKSIRIVKSIRKEQRAEERI